MAPAIVFNISGLGTLLEMDKRMKLSLCNVRIGLSGRTRNILLSKVASSGPLVALQILIRKYFSLSSNDRME
jgi:hypothetical protein